MSYLFVLNNQMQSVLVVVLFVSTILMTMAMLCEMYSCRKIKIDIFLILRLAYIVLCVVWAFIFFNFANTWFCQILAYSSAVVLAFETVLLILKKDWKLAVDFPFLIMLLPFWKYINPIFTVVTTICGVVYLFAKSLSLLLNSLSDLKYNINYYSLKQALDGLKTAVMFEDRYNVVYENVAMKNLLEKLEINKNQGSFEIWQNLKSRQNSKIVDEQNILVFFDKKVFSFSLSNKSKTQIYAFDITKEYLTTTEIESKQAELKAKQTEILQMIENIDEIERQNQVLTLKSKLHDIIGQRLFVLHRVLDVVDEKTFDLDNVKKMLSAMVDEIDNQDVSESKAMQNSIISTFAMVGFDIIINGEMPKESQKSKALANIVRECATNAIRHANATKLFVEIGDDKIKIWDNGKMAECATNEGTGIKGMRLYAQQLGGKLLISTQHGFQVVIDMENKTKGQL